MAEFGGIFCGTFQASKKIQHLGRYVLQGLLSCWPMTTMKWLSSKEKTRLVGILSVGPAVTLNEIFIFAKALPKMLVRDMTFRIEERLCIDCWLNSWSHRTVHLPNNFATDSFYQIILQTTAGRRKKNPAGARSTGSTFKSTRLTN